MCPEPLPPCLPLKGTSPVSRSPMFPPTPSPRLRLGSFHPSTPRSRHLQRFLPPSPEPTVSGAQFAPALPPAQHTTLPAKPVDSSRYATLVRMHCNSACHRRFPQSSSVILKLLEPKLQRFPFMPRLAFGLHCAHPLFYMQVSHSHALKLCATPQVFLLRQITFYACV